MGKLELCAINVVDSNGNVVYASGEVFEDRSAVAEAAQHYRVEMGLKPEYKMERVDLTKKEAGARQLLSMPINGVC